MLEEMGEFIVRLSLANDAKLLWDHDPLGAPIELSTQVRRMQVLQAVPPACPLASTLMHLISGLRHAYAASSLRCLRWLWENGSIVAAPQHP